MYPPTTPSLYAHACKSESPPSLPVHWKSKYYKPSCRVPSHVRFFIDPPLRAMSLSDDEVPALPPAPVEDPDRQYNIRRLGAFYRRRGGMKRKDPSTGNYKRAGGKFVRLKTDAELSEVLHDFKRVWNVLYVHMYWEHSEAPDMYWVWDLILDNPEYLKEHCQASLGPKLAQIFCCAIDREVEHRQKMKRQQRIIKRPRLSSPE